MKLIDMGESGLLASEVVMGCMRLDVLTEKELEELVNVAIEQGINLFDHADIYGAGACETNFGTLLKKQPHIRESILLQSKCGIRPGYYDLSKSYILESVDGILKRLQTDYLDVFILHRPDTLLEPEEIAEAFENLQRVGKVKHFGVSNMNSYQIELLKTAVKQPLIINQLQFSPIHASIVTSGIQSNTHFPGASNRDGHILEYSRIHKMTLQAWSPFQYGFFDGVYIDHPDYEELNEVLSRFAMEKKTTKAAIAVAWILTHPARMQTIVGTTNSQRLLDICEASEIKLTRAEWYEIYLAAGHVLP
jgi:predicted oxidoreductase